MSAPVAPKKARLHQPASLRPSGMLGVGHYRPSRVIPNSELVEAIDSSDEWIQKRSGIIERRWATAEETVQYMATQAAQEALTAASISGAQLDGIIVATVSHLRQTPAIATAIAHDLGSTAAAFDISAACAGFCHGIALAADLVRAGSSDYVLVIGVERLSDLTDPTDRGTAFIFADGAGAAVVGVTPQPGIGPVVWGSDGSQAHLIEQRQDYHEALAGGMVEIPPLKMDGNPVFRWASFEMAKVARQAITAAGITPTDLDLFVPHQANMRITDAMARALKLPDHVRIARDISYQGNTSAASVPLALHQMIADGQAHSGDLALMVAFGAGLSYAAQVVTVP